MSCYTISIHIKSIYFSQKLQTSKLIDFPDIHLPKRTCFPANKKISSTWFVPLPSLFATTFYAQDGGAFSWCHESVHYKNILYLHLSPPLPCSVTTPPPPPPPPYPDVQVQKLSNSALWVDMPLSQQLPTIHPQAPS